MPIDPRWVWGTSPQQAVERLERQIGQVLDQSDDDGAVRRYLAQQRGLVPVDQLAALTITLPLATAYLVLECAQRGMRKGQGRGNIPLSEDERHNREDIIAWARRRKAELIATRHPSILNDHGRPSATEAEAKAAEEASDYGFDRYRVRPAKSTIIRGMRGRVREV
jgi:hypothetical protein